MAAPTPVSALVHSSTLVTAGVYLLIRFHELVGIRGSLLIISILTLLISGVGASFSIDLKKIIALSTLSQLGVMMITISLGLVELSYFHLIRHALFKSLLFLCAGVYIHSYGDVQDIRDIAGVGTIKPLTSLFFIGCSLSLCGFPFLSGFYSKDLILELFIGLGVNSYLWALVVMGTVRTFFLFGSTGLLHFCKRTWAKKNLWDKRRSFYTFSYRGLIYSFYYERFRF